MVRLLPVLALAALLGGCSSGPSAAVRDKRVCAAYETFWDTSYSGGKPSATMLAREHKLLDAIAHAHDKKLAAAARAVAEGQLSLPANGHGETVSSGAKRKLAAIEPNDRFVQSRCDQLGRPINA